MLSALLTAAARAPLAKHDEAALMDALALGVEAVDPDGSLLDADAFALIVWHNPDAAAWVYLFAPEAWLPRAALLREALAAAERLEGERETGGPPADACPEVARVEAAFLDLDRRVNARLLEFLNA